MMDSVTRRHNLHVKLSYPNNPDYDYFTTLTRLNWDEERIYDLTYGKGFIVSRTHGVKKDVKDPNSIFSSRYGQTLRDINPFGNRYRCKCGHTTQRVYNNTICDICHTRVKYVDDDFEYFGWLVLNDHWVIHPGLYTSLEAFIGKDFQKILQPQRNFDEDGNETEVEKPANQPYYGIGMIKFKEQFDEIMEYYRNKNKTKTMYYDDIMSEKDKVFTQSIPVFTTLLRPYDIDKKTFSHEDTNPFYLIINKHVYQLNDLKTLSATQKQEKLPAKLLYDLQLKLQGLFNAVIKIVSGKKGNIRSLFGGKYNFSSRCVIVANPKLRIDEVTLPYSALVELLMQSIINILHKGYNMSMNDAYLYWYKAKLEPDPVVKKIIMTILQQSTSTHRGLPVLINRNPTISYGSILQMFCVGMTDSYTMAVPLQILPLLAADFDGDVLNILYIINQAFFQRSFEVFNPRNTQYISRNDGQFNNLVNRQRDTLINANTMIDLGRGVYTQEDLNVIKKIKSMYSIENQGRQ